MTVQEFLEKQDGLSASELIAASYELFGKDLIATSSFGATSGVLIHLVAGLKLPIRIVYVNTGFLFAETEAYIERLKARYAGMELIELRPAISHREFIARYGGELCRDDPDRCCRINKIEPLDRFIRGEKVRAWLAGVRSQQTDFRNKLSRISISKNGIYKIAPILTWSAKDVHTFMQENEIPFHPLYEKGYTSIGCEPCTELPDGSDERSGRWKGKNKKECGLHTDI